MYARLDDSDGAIVVAAGEAVLRAARVEPHVQRGQIWATEEFRAELNVKKGAEPDRWVRLYRLEF